MPARVARLRVTWSRRAAVVAIAPLLLLACGSDNSPRSVRSDNAPAGGSPVTVGATDLPSGQSVVIAQTLVVADDPATTASALIGAATGGTLSVTARDGTVFTLDVPADALETDTTITATATDSASRSLPGPRSWLDGSTLVTERRVRFTEGFFERLDALLPEERSADGTPSATDFIVF